MIDSAGKIPSGLLEGNIFNPGHFDQCININYKQLNGKYCLIKLPTSGKGQMSENVQTEMRRQMVSQMYHFHSFEMNFLFSFRKA